MAKLRHIAITVPDPAKAAEFYMKAFGMQKVGETKLDGHPESFRLEATQ